MPIPFTCPNCGKYTEVADQYAGQAGPCSGCGQTVVVPGGAAPIKPMAHTMPQAQRARPKSNSTLIVVVVLALVCLCGGGGLVGTALLLPAVQAAREAARRMQCSNNLKQIGLAMHNYHEVHKAFPAGYVADEDGRPLHSWRVAILPYIEHQGLYEQYNFDEPWDSPNNMLVAQQMPEAYRCPSAPDSGPGSNMTHYVVVLDTATRGDRPVTIFGGNRWTRMSDVRDGTSNTLLVAEAAEPVLWTQPDADLHFDGMSFQLNQGPNSIGSFHPMGANVVFADGSVRFISNSVDSQTLRLIIQLADGNPVNLPSGR